ncbi:MAG: potassium transporter TrkA [Hyphomicrobiales bacterium]|nr:MAG: potassium transporter TrkA [Hyphomicrobiales bacterium]
MEHGHTTAFYAHTLVLLGAAVIAVPVFKRLGLGSVLGYLAAGVVVGPFVLQIFADPQEILQFAELGVVFFLFLIGLELKPSRLWSMRHDIFGLGTLQVVVSAALLSSCAHYFGLSWKIAVIAGFGLALSSTAFVMQILEEHNEMSTPHGHKSIAILLLQDLAIVPLLALVAFLAPGGGEASSSMPGYVTAGLAMGALLIVFVAGRYLINPVFGTLAHARAREIMTAAALFVVLGAAWLLQIAGFSMAMGAFLAGVLLAESSFRHELEADIEPFRGILLGLFFMGIGMTIDLGLLVKEWKTIIAAVGALIGIKAVVIYILTRGFGSGHNDAMRSAMLLPQGGEFGFVLFAAALAAGIMSQQLSSTLAAIVTLSMLATPFTVALSRKLIRRPRKDEMEEDFEGAQGSVFIIGFGRFGQIVSQVLLARGIDVAIIDNDPERIRAASRFGFRIYYGDGTRLDVLRAAGADEASIFAVCTARRSADKAIALIQAHFPLARIHARAYDRAHTLELRQRNVDFELRETFESALRFGHETLVALGETSDDADEMIEFIRRRDGERLLIQEADGFNAGTDLIHKRPVKPEPLTEPHRRSTALSDETEVIARNAEGYSGYEDAEDDRS